MLEDPEDAVSSEVSDVETEQSKTMMVADAALDNVVHEAMSYALEAVFGALDGC